MEDVIQQFEKDFKAWLKISSRFLMSRTRSKNSMILKNLQLELWIVTFWKPIS